jgi:hypothetical protein
VTRLADPAYAVQRLDDGVAAGLQCSPDRRQEFFPAGEPGIPRRDVPRSRRRDPPPCGFAAYEV